MKGSLLGSLAVAITFATEVLSVGEWGQCGGINYTGSTTCDAPWVCTELNAYYFQCLPGTTSTTSSSSSKSTTSTHSTTTTTSKTSSKSSSSSSSSISKTSTSTSSASSPTPSGPCPGRTKFKYFGVNESGAEFGNNKIPGVLNTDYTWPSPSSIDYFVGLGFNTFRVPFLLERLAPPATGITGPFDSTYLGGLQTIVSYITGKGAYVLIEPHNYLSYNGAVLSDPTAFGTFWTNLATLFKSNTHVIFDLMNEPNGVPATQVYSMMQAGVNGVRASGATQQLVLVEGTSWTGAWTWTSSGNAAAFAGLTDPANNVAIEMHQYLDSDGSGTNATCVSSTILADRVADATAWLKQTGLRGLLGELGAGNDEVCIEAVYGGLCALQQAGPSVWLGALWWAAGPWWGTYYQSIEPPSGQAITGILPEALEPLL